jgi:streptomycin 6-kinase
VFNIWGDNVNKKDGEWAGEAKELSARLFDEDGYLQNMRSLNLPDSFKLTVIGAFADGEKWLESLPGLITECERRWHITAGPAFLLSFNYAAPAITEDGNEVVLKLGVPNPELSAEIEALRCYAGGAAVRLLDFDKERGFLLLERLSPGKTLSSLEDDEQATRIAAQIMSALWQPLLLPHSFPTVATWFKGLQRLRQRFDGGTGPFPANLVALAEGLSEEFLSSSQSSVLLHGDLHHFNILSAQRQPWIAIDPKGVAGEPAYEVGALLRNPSDRFCTDIQIQRRRVALLVEELGFDKERIVGWGIAQAVLSGWWSYEDCGEGWESAFACADVLARLMK